MRRSREFSAIWLRTCVVVGVTLTLGAPVRAQTRSPPRHPAPAVGAPAPAPSQDDDFDDFKPSPPVAASNTSSAPGASTGQGAEALERARAAWEKGDYDIAEPLYREAVETGGLAPNEVLDAYVHLGATRSVLGKKASAQAAFRSAALIDPHFVVPSEAGKRAAVTADKARQTVARAGGIALRADFPPEVGTGESAQIDATLDTPHLGVATRVALNARDPLSGKAYSDVQDSAPQVHFKVPTSLALPGATLVLRVDALDVHQNRLASVEGKTHVRGAAAAPVAIAGVAAAPGAAALKGTFSGSGVAVAAPGAGADGSKSKKSFWATPWPYVIGGVALAAGGTAIYFAAKPNNDVNLGAVQVGLSR